MNRIDFYEALSNQDKDNLLLLTLYNHDVDKLYEAIKENDLFSEIIYKDIEMEALHDNIISISIPFKNKESLKALSGKQYGWISKVNKGTINFVFNK